MGNKSTQTKSEEEIQNDLKEEGIKKIIEKNEKEYKKDILKIKEKKFREDKKGIYYIRTLYLATI